jgi:CcmD family protein
MTLPRRLIKISTLCQVLVAALVGAAPARAQDFVKVADDAREQLPATPFVGVAYGFIWVAILVYVFGVARRLGRVQGELEDLRRRLDRGPGDGPARR